MSRMNFFFVRTTVWASLALTGSAALALAAEPDKATSSTSLSDEDRARILSVLPGESRPVGFMSARAQKSSNDDHVEITTVEPDPEENADPQPKVSPDFTPSTVGETGTL